MSDMKCPFCGQELTVYEYSAFTNVGFLPCEKCRIEGTKEMWEALIRTRKALDVAIDAIKSAKTRLELINNSKFANLNNVLQIQSQCEILKIEKSLEQITALEQKE